MKFAQVWYLYVLLLFSFITPLQQNAFVMGCENPQYMRVCVQKLPMLTYGGFDCQAIQHMLRT